MSETAIHQDDHSGQVKRIWLVFWILAIITAVEVALGIMRPDFLLDNTLWDLKLQNWIFIILTIVKAYYITWTFMHMEQEKAVFRRAVVWTITFYMLYMIFIVLVEAQFVKDMVQNDFLKWDF